MAVTAAGVAVVTDSTTYVPESMAADLDPAVTGVIVVTVPLTVVISGRSRAEGLEVTSAEVAAALSSRAFVTTSRPAPQVFVEAYRRLAAQGHADIVSVHLSAELSGTVDAARSAARTVAAEGISVTVVDSRVLAMGLGYAVASAVATAAAGGTRAEVAEAAGRRAQAVQAWFYVDTLEFLHRGGRISGAAMAVGSALSVKPVLALVDGRLEVHERVRTASRALARLQETALDALAHELSAGRQVEIAVHHLGALERAQGLAEALRGAAPPGTAVPISEVGAVVGAHTGPGLVGVILAPRAS